MGSAEINDQLVISLTLAAGETEAFVRVPRACTLITGYSQSTGPASTISVYRVRQGQPEVPVSSVFSFNPITIERMTDIYPVNAVLQANDLLKVTKDVAAFGRVYFLVAAPGVPLPAKTV